MEEAIALIHAAGGKAVLAHPGVYEGVCNLEEALSRMTEAGLDGLEVFYPYGSEARGGAAAGLIPRFAQLAERFGLFATGGSDYHGGNKDIRLGEAWPGMGTVGAAAGCERVVATEQRRTQE